MHSNHSIILLLIIIPAFCSEKTPLYLTKQPQHIETKKKQETTQTTITLSDHVSSALFDAKNNIATKGASVRLYNQKGEKLSTTSHENRAEDVCFHPSKEHIMSAGHDNTARVRNYDGKEVLFLKHNAAVNAARFDTTGRYTLTAGNDKLVKLWDGETLKTTFIHNHSVHWGRFIQNNENIVSLDIDGKVHKWDLKGTLQASINTEKKFSKYNTTLNETGDLIAYCTSSNTVKIKNFDNKEDTIAQHKEKITSITFMPFNNSIITSSNDATVKIWDITGKQLASMEHPSEVWQTKIDESAKLIATTCKDQKARIWDTKGQPLMSFAHEKPLESITFNADSTLLATVSWGSLTVWNLKK